MGAGKSRVGIERKILTSILWVGILPMIVALVAGYIAGRRYTSTAVQQTLLTAAEKTSDGINLVFQRELSRAAHLARRQSLVQALVPLPAGGLRIMQDETLKEELRQNFSIYFSSDVEDMGPHAISLFGPDGVRVFTTDENSSPVPLSVEGMSGVETPQFKSYNTENGFSGTITVEVRPEDGEAVLGYLSVQVGIESLLRFVMGVPDEQPEQGTDRYQVAYLTVAGAAVMSHLEERQGRLQLVAEPIDNKLKAILMERPAQGTAILSGYLTEPNIARSAENVILAYQRLPDDGLPDSDVYLVVYRLASVVYSGMNTASVVVFLVCTLAIAILCINAYRDVHNNIVRPVSLLNEGAQIVRQGDFDLKLKIDTGDEIEELATSFNEMAVALSINIRQLEESEENYRSLVTSMRDGVYQTNADGVLTFLNSSGADILGLASSEEAPGSDMDGMFEDSGGFASLMRQLGSADDGERARIRMRRMDGRWIPVEISCNRAYDDSGTHTGYEGILRDITKTVRLEEEARERSERIAAINQIANVINSSLEAGRLYESLVIELKKLVTFDYASVTLLSEMGTGFDGRQIWPDEELQPGHTFVLDSEHSYAAWVAREHRCLLVEDLRSGPYAHFANQFPSTVRSCLCVPLYATGRITGTLNLGRHDAGAFSRAHVEALEQMSPHLAVAIRNAQMLVNLQLSLEEVTRGREKLHAANEELKTLDEMKTNLLSNVSHELRTPLVSVMGYNDMILNGKAGPITNTQQEYLEISLRNIEKLVTLIENLLDFSRLHRGDERLIFDTFDLVDCARTSAQIVKPVADSRQIELELLVPEGEVLVEGEKAKMGQVFNNLLSNAVKFNETGGRVTIHMERTSRTVEVVVSDTGIGIPEEALDKVFTRFYQYDASSTRKYGGTGIGLSIAQDIVRLHGSSITVTSKPGEGSTFRFELTLSGVDKEWDAEPGEGTAALPYSDTHLLVELYSEDRSLGVQVRNILFSEGIDMIHAASHEAALDMAQRHHPDCVLVDLDSGPEPDAVLKALLEDSFTGSLPIVILTNDEEKYERYRQVVASRIKRSFRKSNFLSGLHYALSRGVDTLGPVGSKILCVDDDKEIQTFIARCLEGEGYECECCSSGEEALERMKSREYGLVLLDIAMPGIDGWKTCRRIRETPEFAGVKVYMVSAKPIDHNLNRMKESGADGFLLKPFRPEDLVDLVQGLELPATAK